jgi:predicted MPP superfamily phosphohydrolase
MKRREALTSLIAGSFLPEKDVNKKDVFKNKGTFTLNDNHLRFFNPNITERFTIIMLADTHLFRDDNRGEPFQQFSGRMAKAYNQTKHFKTNEPTNPEESFVNTLVIAQKEKAKLVALIGDIFSFPSEAAIEWVLEKLKSFDLPHLYVAGNHDWHYEGMKGSINVLRDTWIQKRLLPIYKGDNPLMTSREINGVKFIALDNSNYQISSEQLDFFREQISTKKPAILMLHIPLYAPERSVGYGCGHPEWGAKTDKNFELEGRERWPENGHTTITMAFYKEVLAADNLIGILAGHIHKDSVDVLNGIPQIVTLANAQGAYLKVEFIPKN